MFKHDVTSSSHGGLQFIKYHIKHSHLLYMYCYPAIGGYHAVSVMLLFLFLEAIFKKCLILFSGKNKKNIINLSSAEFARILVKVSKEEYNRNRKSTELLQRICFNTSPHNSYMVLCFHARPLWVHLSFCNMYGLPPDLILFPYGIFYSISRIPLKFYMVIHMVKIWCRTITGQFLIISHIKNWFLWHNWIVFHWIQKGVLWWLSKYRFSMKMAFI